MNKHILLGVLVCLMLVQFIDTYRFIFRQQANLSWYNFREMRETHSIAANEPQMVWNDYDTGVDSAVETLHIKAFFSSYYNGYARLISPETPIYNVSAYGQRENVIKDFERNVMDTLSHKHNVYALTVKSDLMNTITNLNAQHYLVDSIVAVYPKFLLINNPLYLLRIKYYSPEQYFINSRKSLLREENRSTYNYTDSKAFKAFVIDDPFLYNNNDRPDHSKLHINGKLYTLNASDRNQSIITLPETRGLTLNNEEPRLSYFVITQQLEPIAILECPD